MNDNLSPTMFLSFSHGVCKYKKEPQTTMPYVVLVVYLNNMLENSRKDNGRAQRRSKNQK